MNQSYLNCPSFGGAMSAEEYAAALNTDYGNPSTPPCAGPSGMVCCCREFPAPTPVPEIVAPTPGPTPSGDKDGGFSFNFSRLRSDK